MMRLPPFRYLAPTTVDEAARMLAEFGPEATPVAGGTDLFPNMKRRQIEPRYVVGLRAIRELHGVDVGPGGISIRANTTLAETAAHPRLLSEYPAVAHAAGLVSTVHLRRMGTVGGNLCLDTRCNYYDQSYEWRQALGFCMKKDGQICWVATSSPRCWAVSSSDLAPVMVALGARVRLASALGERVVPAAQLYADDGINYLGKRADEILVDVTLPPSDGLKTTYLKLRRRDSFDFPILGVAVALHQDNGVVRDGRIVLGAVASAPLEAADASAMLAGQHLTEDLIDAVADASWRHATPLDNTDLNYAWRKRMVRVHVRRALRELAGLPFEPRLA